MKTSWKVVAVHSARSAIVQGPVTIEIAEQAIVRCVETAKRYRPGAVGMIPVDAHLKGLRMIGLEPLDGDFDLCEGMTFESESADSRRDLAMLNVGRSVPAVFQPDARAITVRPITSARIDVPLRSTHAYLFVGPEERARGSWWDQLYEHLQELPEQPLEWKFEPVHEIFVSIATLSEASRQQLHQLLRTAPPGDVANHKTLRHATALGAEAVARLRLVFFSKGA